MSETKFQGDHKTGTFETSRGVRLFEQWWQPQQEPKAAVIKAANLSTTSGFIVISS